MIGTNFQKYDVVALTEAIAPDLPSGTLGVVLLVLDKECANFEVEFFNEEKEAISVMSVDGRLLKFVQRPTATGLS